ncbi:MAG: ABC transporter ATP-binding protein [Firmicutes bacterium]|nr:ABC transporter ATP-binding protein [Bacillota bacterium]
MTGLRKAFVFLRPYRVHVTAAIVLLGTSSGLGMVSPWLVKLIIDRVILGGDRTLLPALTLGVVLVSAARGLTLFGRSYLQEYVGQHVVYDLRNAFYSRLQHVSFNFYDKAFTGDLMSRATGDLERLRVFLSQGSLEFINAVVTFSFVSVILARLDWRLTLVCLATSPFLALSVIKFDRRIRPAWAAIERQMGNLTSSLQEIITGMRVVKSFGREAFERERFGAENERFMETNLAASRVWSKYFPIMDLLTALSGVVLLWYGGREVILGRMSVGTLVAFNGYLFSLIWPVRHLGWFINLFEQARTASERVFEVLRHKLEIQDDPLAVDLEIQGAVRFQNVSFYYGETRKERRSALTGVNLDVEPGQRVALIGPTGSGKTSVINLLLRFYEPNGGLVTIDGVDVRKIRLECLRRQVAVVPQDTFLFSTSVRENIAFGRPEAALREIVEAAVAAQAHDFIEALPQGYDTVVGERGVGLSGGQRQRIAIARAVLMNPRILILDDSTSSVDIETERLIQEVITGRFSGRTFFIIAQRLSTIMDCDKIVIFEDGAVREAGTHEELEKSGGLYSRLYEKELAGGGGFHGAVQA